jgi:hypothetical protein
LEELRQALQSGLLPERQQGRAELVLAAKSGLRTLVAEEVA